MRRSLREAFAGAGAVPCSSSQLAFLTGTAENVPTHVFFGDSRTGGEPRLGWASAALRYTGLGGRFAHDKRQDAHRQIKKPVRNERLGLGWVVVLDFCTCYRTCLRRNSGSLTENKLENARKFSRKRGNIKEIFREQKKIQTDLAGNTKTRKRFGRRKEKGKNGKATREERTAERRTLGVFLWNIVVLGCFSRALVALVGGNYCHCVLAFCALCFLWAHYSQQLLAQPLQRPRASSWLPG